MGAIISLLMYTYIVFSSPQFLRSNFNGIEGLSRGFDVPELDGAIMTAGGELILIIVTPVNVVDARHVSCDITRRRRRFLEQDDCKEDFIVTLQESASGNEQKA